MDQNPFRKRSDEIKAFMAEALKLQDFPKKKQEPNIGREAILAQRARKESDAK